MNAVAAAEIFEDGEGPVRRVRATLKGPVIATLRRLMPELSHIPEAATYDRVLESTYLLHRSFRMFRTRRADFRHILTDSGGREITDDTTPLTCGRTLDQVVAMIVCTAARRYFRRHLGMRPPPQSAERDTGLPRPIRLLAMKAARTAAPPPDGLPSPADELYDCIKHYLLYEWQVPLVPTYARMTPLQVKALGRELLDYDSPAKLAGALGLPYAVADAPPLARPARAPGRGAGDAGDVAFAEALSSPEVRKALGWGEMGFHPNAVFEAVSRDARAALTDDLGMAIDQVAAVMLAAYGAMGDDNFKRVFGAAADPTLMRKFIDHARRIGIGPASPLSEIVAFIKRVFSRVKTAATD